jgi:hypothetical protein
MAGPTTGKKYPVSCHYLENLTETGGVCNPGSRLFLNAKLVKLPGVTAVTLRSARVYHTATAGFKDGGLFGISPYPR